MVPPRPVVFVVDDDASVRKSLARLVRIAGYEVEAFASVGGAVALLTAASSTRWLGRSRSRPSRATWRRSRS